MTLLKMPTKGEVARRMFKALLRREKATIAKATEVRERVLAIPDDEMKKVDPRNPYAIEELVTKYIPELKDPEWVRK